MTLPRNADSCMIKGCTAFLIVLPQKEMYSEMRVKITGTSNLMQNSCQISLKCKPSLSIPDQVSTISRYKFNIFGPDILWRWRRKKCKEKTQWAFFFKWKNWSTTSCLIGCTSVHLRRKKQLYWTIQSLPMLFDTLERKNITVWC